LHLAIFRKCTERKRCARLCYFVITFQIVHLALISDNDSLFHKLTFDYVLISEIRGDLYILSLY